MQVGNQMSLGSQGLDSLMAGRLATQAQTNLESIDKDTPAEEAANKLEGLFATMLVKEMRNALSTGFFGDGSAGDIYGGWFDEHVGAALARDGALNLAGMIKANLSSKAATAPEEVQ